MKAVVVMWLVKQEGTHVTKEPVWRSREAASMG